MNFFSCHVIIKAVQVKDDNPGSGRDDPYDQQRLGALKAKEIEIPDVFAEGDFLGRTKRGFAFHEY